MPKTSKPSKKRIYSVKTYKARIERANARIKELEAKSKRLETSKTRITRLSTLIKQRDALEKAGDEKKLASLRSVTVSISVVVNCDLLLTFAVSFAS